MFQQAQPVQWVALLDYAGGHGMSPGDTVGMQIVLWGFLNLHAFAVRHPDHGEFQVIWPDEHGVPTTDAVIRLSQAGGQVPSAQFPIDDRWEVCWGTWVTEG